MQLTAEREDYAGYDQLVEAFFERGWTDGLPVLPPTPEKVEQSLVAAGLEPNDVLGHVRSREITVHAQEVAINAVMAGCRAEYMPAVAAAVRALLDERHIAHSTTATLAGPSQVVIVNGPIRNELDIACEGACFGPGFRANATIGRALRLVARNVLRSVPGGLDRAAFSTPGRYSFCFGEDEDNSHWAPLHVERGFDASMSTVTVHSALMPLVVHPMSDVPEQICAAFVRSTHNDGMLWEQQMGTPADVVLVIGAEHRRWFEAAGWDKARIRGALWHGFVAQPVPAGRGAVRLTSPDQVLLVAAGGPAVDWSVVLVPHLGRAITEPIAVSTPVPAREECR